MAVSSPPAGKWLLSLGCACLCLRCLRPWPGACPPLQLLAARDMSRTPNTFPFCPLFLFPPSPPSTHGSLCHLPTHAKLPWSQPQTPLVPNRVNVLRSADGLSFALHLATYALGHIPFLFNQLCPPPHSGFSHHHHYHYYSPRSFSVFRSFNAKYAPYTLFNPITPSNK